VLTVLVGGGESTAVEQPGSLAAAFDRAAAATGETVALTLSYRLPAGGTIVDQPVPGGLEGLTILGREALPGKLAFKVLVDQLGTLKTGAIVLPWLDGQGRPQKLYADSVALQVTSVLGEKPADAQLRPIQDIVPVRPPWLRYLPWLLGALAALLAVAALWWWLKRRRRQREIAAAAEPPHLWATRELQRLEGQRLFEKGKVKEHYFRFSEILRRYLEALRGFPAAEYTVEEIARSVHDEKDRQLLALLRQADLVKFADAAPTAARKDDEVREALAYVRATTPPPAAPGAGGAVQEARR
jgi:hypothetical protein